jgi:hypothetical protein
MGLEGITPVGDKEKDPSAGLEGTDHLTDGSAVILYVLEYFMAEDQVKGGRGEWDEFPGRVDDVRRVLACFVSPLEVVFQPDHGAPKRGEMLHIHAHPTSVFQDLAFDAFPCGMEDHLQPALLSGPPYIGRFAA